MRSMNECIYYRDKDIKRVHTDAFTKEIKQNRKKNTLKIYFLI